jgi:hexulose-6-phosphate isomerase
VSLHAISSRTRDVTTNLIPEPRTMTPRPNRRSFLRATGTLAAAAAIASTSTSSSLVRAADEPKAPGKFRKAVKYGMIAEGKTVREKFDLIKSIGFEGVEVDAPGGVDKQEALDASKASDIQIHGVIDAIHWKSRLSDPDPAVREKGVQALIAALDEAKFYGASTVLLVPGKVTDPKNENFEQAWARSSEELKKAVPKARELGVHIAVEIVWNDFLTTPELMVKYIDQFNDPIVGCYLDPSNVLRYGKDTGVRGADWVRALGKRLLKFDFKGYSHAKSWVPIGEGDEHWPDVLKALDEVGYKDPADGGRGWATAEVKGGGREHLMDVAARMDRVLGMA